MKSIIAATLAKLAQTVAEAVAERDNHVLNNSRESTAVPRELGSPVTELCSDAVTTEPVDDLDQDGQVRVRDLADEQDINDEIQQLESDQELNLEEELKQAEMKVPENALMTPRLPDSPPSSRQDLNKTGRQDSGSDTTPEDGLTLDINIDDLPNDPNIMNSDFMEHKAYNKINDNVCLSSYTTECDLIADILVNEWLKSSNSDLRNETMAAVGHMSAMLSREKLESITSTIVSTIISLYRKISVPYNLTCTLAQLLTAIVQQEAHECLRPQLDSLMGAVLSQASVLPCYSEPNSVGNHSEALRCCHLLGTAFPAQLGGQLLCRLENASHVQRVAALVVVRHLLSCK